MSFTSRFHKYQIIILIIVLNEIPELHKCCSHADLNNFTNQYELYSIQRRNKNLGIGSTILE